jgi:kinetochore protein NNF1
VFFPFCRPHTLGANDLYQAHLTPYLREVQGALNAKLETTQSQNAELAERIQVQRKEIEALLTGLETVVGDIEGAASASTQFSKERNLRQESLQMDEEVRARVDI